MTDPIELTAATVGSAAAGVALTAAAIEDVADVVVEVNRGLRRLLKMVLVLTVIGIVVVVAAGAFKRLKDRDGDDDFAY
jgi:hypothetical protein